MTENANSDVGYRNPPKHTRFKKGKSGNPRGRPRKRDDLNTVLQRVLNRKVRIKDDDRRIPIREALIRKLRDLALQGDKQALALQRQILADAGYNEPDPVSLAENNKKLEEAMASLSERVRALWGAHDR